jgi:hypothetical protein
MIFPKGLLALTAIAASLPWNLALSDLDSDFGFGNATLDTRQAPTTSCDPGCVYCTYKGGGDFVVYWGIHLPNDKGIDATCGGGVLDNVRGQACTPTNWQCVYDDDNDPNSGAWMYFTAVNGCREASVEAALKAAGTAMGKTWYQNVICGPEPSD